MKHQQFLYCCSELKIYPIVFLSRNMSHLYADPNWSQKDLGELLVHVQKQVGKNKFLASFALERLKYYAKELWQRTQEGHRISFTDLWGLIIEAMLCDGVLDHVLFFT